MSRNDALVAATERYSDFISGYTELKLTSGIALASNVRRGLAQP